MSRLEEVEARIISADGAYHDGAWIGPESLRHLARTLAAEVDARDAVIAELMAMLKPDKHRPSWEHDEYRRACEIAGRAE